jgi:hypothetical protein
MCSSDVFISDVSKHSKTVTTLIKLLSQAVGMLEDLKRNYCLIVSKIVHMCFIKEQSDIFSKKNRILYIQNYNAYTNYMLLQTYGKTCKSVY